MTTIDLSKRIWKVSYRPVDDRLGRRNTSIFNADSKEEALSYINTNCKVVEYCVEIRNGGMRIGNPFDANGIEVAGWGEPVAPATIVD